MFEQQAKLFAFLRTLTDSELNVLEALLVEIGKGLTHLPEGDPRRLVNLEKLVKAIRAMPAGQLPKLYNDLAEQRARARAYAYCLAHPGTSS